MIKQLTCIVCPRGCKLTIDEDNKVSGNMCKRGIDYAINELTDPKRMLTSTVKVNSNVIKRCPVVTTGLIPYKLMFEVVNEINKITLDLPITIHQVVISNVLGLGVDVVTTKEYKEYNNGRNIFKH